MRYLILILFCIGLSNATFAQTVQATQTPTVYVDSVHVNYKAIPSGTAAVGSQQSYIKVFPEINVILNSQNLGDIIELKISDAVTFSTVYQVSYALNSSTVMQGNRTLFQKQSSIVFLSTPNFLRLDSYAFEIKIKDAQNNVLQTYISTK